MKLKNTIYILKLSKGASIKIKNSYIFTANNLTDKILNYIYKFEIFIYYVLYKKTIDNNNFDTTSNLTTY